MQKDISSDMTIDQIIHDSTNPFVILKIVIESPQHKVEKAMESNMEKNISIKLEPFQLEIVDITDNISFVITRKKILSTIESVLNDSDIVWNKVDSSKEIWNMTDTQLNELLELTENSEIGQEAETDLYLPPQRDRILMILKSYFLRKYTIDDVLDKISFMGSASLNQINRFILESEKENNK